MLGAMTEETFEDLGDIDTGTYTNAQGQPVAPHLIADTPEDDNPRTLAGAPLDAEGWDM